jgi:hypothetical protein
VPGCARIWETRWWGAVVPLHIPPEISAKFRWKSQKSTADPPENKQTNQPQIPGGIQMQIHKMTTIKWNQLELIFFLEVQGDRIDNSESNPLLRI